MNKFISIFLLTILSSGLMFAQPSPMTFGDVGKTDFREEKNEMYRNAEAYVMCSYGETEFSSFQGKIKITTYIHIRIKVNKKSGMEYANIEIPLYINDKISYIQGKTYNMVDDKITEKELPKEAIFTEKFSRYYRIHKFALPNITEGTIFEYSYKFETDNYYNFRSWPFQREIPVKYSEYRAAIPSAFQYKMYMQGYHPLAINESDDQWVNIFGKNYNGTKFRWGAKDIPAFKEEPYMTTSSDFMSKLKFELSGVNFPGYSASILPTYESITKELLFDTEFGKAVTSCSFASKEVEKLIAEKNTKTEKAQAIYNYIIKNIKWNGNNGLFASQPLRRTFKQKSGNAADINLLLIAMLREAGVLAHPVALSTRGNGILPTWYALASKLSYCLHKH